MSALFQGYTAPAGGGRVQLSSSALTPFWHRGMNVTADRKVRYAPATGIGAVAGASFALDFPDLGAGVVGLTPIVGGVAPTYTRAGDATTVNNVGRIISVAPNVPRSFYDPATHEYLGFLCEAAATNICLQSSAFNVAPWAPQGAVTVTPNTHIAPDGTLSADTLTDDDPLTFEGQGQAFVVPDDTASYAFSIFARKTSNALNTFGVNFSLIGGTSVSFLPRLNTNSGIADAGRVEDYGDYWRWSGALQNNATGNTTLVLGVYPATGFNNGSLPGPDNAASVGSAVVWHSQVELGRFATSPIPTLAVPVTRAADILTYPSAPWYNAVEGTILSDTLDYLPAASADTSILSVLSDGTLDNRIVTYAVSALVSLSVFMSSASVEQMAFTVPWAPNTRYRTVVGAKLNSSAFTVNGGAVQGDNACLMPVGVTRLDIGSQESINQLRGTVRRFVYWPARFPDTALRLLSAGADFPSRNGLKFTFDGALLLSQTNVKAATAPGGVAVDAAGYACYAESAPDVIHQGVGLMNDGRLAVTLGA